MYSPFFCNDAPPAAIYTLSLHDALPIYPGGAGGFRCVAVPEPGRSVREAVHSRTEKAGGRDSLASLQTLAVGREQRMEGGILSGVRYTLRTRAQDHGQRGPAWLCWQLSRC